MTTCSPPVSGISMTSGADAALTRSLGPRRRWWRHAFAEVQRAAERPVEVHLTAEHRIVDVMSVYGLRIDLATGRLTGLMMETKQGRIRRWPMRSPNV